MGTVRRINEILVGPLNKRPTANREIAVYIDEDTGISSISNGEAWDEQGVPENVALVNGDQRADSFNLTGPSRLPPADQPLGGSSLAISGYGSDNVSAYHIILQRFPTTSIGRVHGGTVWVTRDPSVPDEDAASIYLYFDVMLETNGAPDMYNSYNDTSIATLADLVPGVPTELHGDFGYEIDFAPDSAIWVGVEVDYLGPSAVDVPVISVEASTVEVDTADFSPTDAQTEIFPPDDVTQANAMRITLDTTMPAPERLDWTPGAGLITSMPGQPINVQSYGVVADDVTDNTDAFTLAGRIAAFAGKALYIPAGRYASKYLNVPNGCPGVYGDGMGRSIVHTPSGFNLSSGNYSWFQLVDSNPQFARDLSLVVKDVVNGSYSGGVFAGNGQHHISRLEITGLTSAGGFANGGVYFLASSVDGGRLPAFEISVPITDTGVPVEVTPSSMLGLAPGVGIWSDDEAHTALITGVTDTTFTAIFDDTHAAGATFHVFGDADLRAVVEECWIHDCPSSHGIRVISNGNTIRHNLIERVGSTSNHHGIYAAGGFNHYEHNRVLQAAGFSFHGYKVNGNGLDASGDLWLNNISINPVYAHMIVQGTDNTDGAPVEVNPLLPSAASLARYTTLVGNIFRQTRGAADPIYYGAKFFNPVMAMQNVFEDVNLETTVPSQFIGNFGVQINREVPPTASGTGLADSVKLGNVGISGL